MKVLTLREPWASLIGKGIKTIETRSWSTNYRGELYIHAGKHKVPTNDKRITTVCQYLDGEPFQYGNIFVRCNLVDCILIDEKYAAKIKEENPLNFYCGNYTPGRYAWVLEDVSYISPIPATGRLSIWNYNE
ncbi:ASCH domain-containing protein [Bacteroides heparinolyticus]|uniref:ASCH domain-containing protein n=1 Tax=Prevotella heparinolytica TaxID=28113 RepID=UPI0035A0FB05